MKILKVVYIQRFDYFLTVVGFKDLECFCVWGNFCNLATLCCEKATFMDWNHSILFFIWAFSVLLCSLKVFV